MSTGHVGLTKGDAMTTATQPVTQSVNVAEQVPVLLSQVAGYVGHRTVAIGLRRGLIRVLADRPGSRPRRWPRP